MPRLQRLLLARTGHRAAPCPSGCGERARPHGPGARGAERTESQVLHDVSTVTVSGTARARAPPSQILLVAISRRSRPDLLSFLSLATLPGAFLPLRPRPAGLRETSLPAPRTLQPDPSLLPVLKIARHFPSEPCSGLRVSVQPLGPCPVVP